MASEAKKAKVESPKWFTFKKCPTDVTLKFDDGQELYVSKDFLIYASPVFEAMFKHDMKEKRGGTVELKGKSYTDFLNLLLAMHPRAIKPIDKSTVLSVMELAHEYQMSAQVTRCKYELTQLIKETSNNKGLNDHSKINIYLKIIKIASKCSLEDIVTEAIHLLSKFKLKYINGTWRRYSIYEAETKENKTIFESLDIADISNIYLRRLEEIDK